MLVSHDRALLDVATKETLDLSDGRCDLYAGAYSFYLEERPKLMERLQGEYERAVAEVKRQEQVFFQYREWARLNSKFASRARARLTLLERARSRVERPEKRRDRTLSRLLRLGCARPRDGRGDRRRGPLQRERAHRARSISCSSAATASR